MSVDRTTLEAQPRTAAGKGHSRRLRTSGLVPAVVYGRQLETPAHIAVDPIQIKKAINTPHKLNTIITLKVKDQPDRTVLLKDYQQDPVTRAVLHADFIAVRENEKVKVKLPVVLVGKAEGVANGGVLSQARRELEVWAIPSAIPEKLEVDVTSLKIASSLHVNDLKLPEGIEIKTHVNFTLAVVTAPEAEIVAPVAAAAAAPAAAAAGGNVPGAAPGSAPKAAPGAAPGTAPAKGAAEKKK